MDPIPADHDKWMVCYGNPAAGFIFVGVFENAADAILWCEDNIHADTWWVMPILTVEMFQEANA